MKTLIPMKPYKLSEADLDNLRYPVICQPKLDGFRCVIRNGKALSYSLKPIRNKFVRDWLEHNFSVHGKFWTLIDGELMLRDRTSSFQQIQSAFNSFAGAPNFQFHIFDNVPRDHFDYPFVARGVGYWRPEWCDVDSRLVNVINIKCSDKNDVLHMEKQMLSYGYEGIIIRDPNAPYKFGRSTLKEGYLLALKRFTDAEAKIIGAYPLERNLNEAEVNAHGLLERSSSQLYKFADNLLGGFTVVGLNGPFKGVEFNVGSGFTNAQRVEFWREPSISSGRIIKYKYQACGSDKKPRQPIFLGFRSKEDL
jgi:DNA ligase 1